MTKGQNMYYKLQSSTHNTLCGVSPLSNRKVFLSYHQPSYLYGQDTMPVNIADMAKVEVKYRQTLKNMLSLPDCVSSPLVYLCCLPRRRWTWIFSGSSVSWLSLTKMIRMS